MPRWLLRLLAFTACTLGIAVPASAEETYTFFHENVMGTSLELQVVAENSEAASRAEARVLAEIDRLAMVYSTYDASSELQRWRRSPKAPVNVSPELLGLLAACDRWRERSEGAFDPRVEVFTRIWTEAAKRNQVPSPGKLAEARESLDQPAWRIDVEHQTLERLSDGPISLNAIAKGEIVERACAAGLGDGREVRGIMLNVGGDLRLRGGLARTVGIVRPWADSETSEPLATVTVKNQAVATSGRSQRGFEVRGRWYSHIIDPRTGTPVDHVQGATVIAPRSGDADALATICNVLSPEKSLALVATVPGASCLIVASDGQVFQSPNWPGEPAAEPRMKTQDAKAATATTTETKTRDAATWNPDFELQVDFEINQPAEPGTRYRRPYVAVWVEDKDGFPVRYLTLWVSMGGAGPFQWIPDLKRWYKVDQDRKKVEKKDLTLVIARPTRPPGKYKVVWDGKDNNKKPLPPGEYTICIDAAREHGTYQNLRKQVTIGDEPFSHQLDGGVEIKGASIDYHRKPAAKSSR